MSRYRVEGAWRPLEDHRLGVVHEVADALDTVTGRVYRQGAHRVTVNGKPGRGKGGSVPYWGEMAFHDAARLADDLWWSRRELAAAAYREESTR